MRSFLSIALFFWGLFVAFFDTSYGLMLKVSEEELARKADVIIVGKVIEMSYVTNYLPQMENRIAFTQYSDGRYTAAIETVLTIEVLYNLKGAKEGEHISLAVPGGIDRSRGFRLRIEHEPMFRVNEILMFFLKRTPTLEFSLVAHEQGCIRLLGNSKDVALHFSRDLRQRIKSFVDGNRYILPRSSKIVRMFSSMTSPVITSILNATGIGAGTGHIVQINGNNFYHNGQPAEELLLLGQGYNARTGLMKIGVFEEVSPPSGTRVFVPLQGAQQSTIQIAC